MSRISIVVIYETFTKTILHSLQVQSQVKDVKKMIFTLMHDNIIAASQPSILIVFKMIISAP